MKTFYLAASWTQREDALKFSREIERASYWICVSSWFFDKANDDAAFNATKDLREVDRADALILMAEGRSQGKMVEFGYALALGKETP